MKVLLTGANGFVAPYVSLELSRAEHQVVLTGREPATLHREPYFAADLTDPKQVEEAIAWAKPEAVIHLAGIADVGGPAARRAPIMTSVNVEATAHLCKALQKQAQPCILLFISSGLVYQPTDDKNFRGYHEKSALGPVNDYGWSKLAAEAIVRIYESSHLKTYIIRPFNHLGPGQDTRFVAPALAKRFIDAKQESTIPVGDLSAKRDFTDVRDIVRAYRLILELQPEQKTFVLGSGSARPIQEIFDFFVKYSGKKIGPEKSTNLLRSEHAEVYANAKLAFEVLGWSPTIPLEQTLKELYDHLLKSQAT